MPTFYQACKNNRLLTPLTVYHYNPAKLPVPGCIYKHLGGIFVALERGVGLVLSDEDVNAMIANGMIDTQSLDPKNLSECTVN